MNHLIEYTVIGCYLLFLLAVGFAFRRFNHNVSDYFRNGCRGTWWLVGMSAFMSGISAYTFTGAAGVAFEAGWSVSIIYIGNALGYLVNVLFLAAWFRQLRAITVPEVIRLRFGALTQQVYAVSGVLLNVLYSGMTLWALAIFSASVFGYDVDVVIIVLGLVVMFYSFTGGSWAVMATDFIQGMIMMPMTVLITFLCLRAVGGVDGFIEMVAQRGLRDDFAIIHQPGEFPMGAFTLAWALAMVVQQVWTHNTLNSAARYFAVKDGRDARKGAALAFVMMSVGALFWFIPPMAARLLYEDQTLATALNKPAEAAFAIASVQLLPQGLVGLMVVAMFAATMSSLDTGLNRNAAVFVRDIYPLICRFLGRPMADERTQFRMSQLFTLIFGLLIIASALYFSRASGMGMFDIMLNLASMLGLPLAVPMLLCLFIRRVPWWSALVSIGLGWAGSLLATCWPTPWTFQQKVLVNLVAGSAGFVLTMPFWAYSAAAYRQMVDAFFTRMRTPVDFDKEVGKPNDQRQLAIIGGFMIAIAGFVALLLLLPNDRSGRWSILFIAGCMVSVGLVMVIAGKRSQREAWSIQPGAAAQAAASEESLGQQPVADAP